MLYYLVRRRDTFHVTWIGRSGSLPDVDALLISQAAAHGGVAEDYEFVLIDPALFADFIAVLHRAPIWDGTHLTFAAASLDKLFEQQRTAFKRTLIVRKTFTTLLDRKVIPVWQPI